MTVRERSLIAALSIALLALSSTIIAPAFLPASGAHGPSLPPARPYVEGVVGHATNASPFGARSAADRDLVALLFRGLVHLGPEQSIVGDLAERWDVDSTGAIWTFHLRPGLVWQDGEPITADDVGFTLEALANPSYKGPGAESWREVSVTVIDSLTVSLKLATPLGGFLAAATQPIAPAHLLSFVPIDQLSTSDFGRHPVGSGPFRLTALESDRAALESWSPGTDLPTLGGAPSQQPAATDSLATAGPTGATVQPAPYLSGIELRFYDTPEALTDDWQRGLLDGASGLAPGDALRLAASSGARMIRYPSANLLAVIVNLRPGKAQFGALAIRRALLAAIDRSAILSNVLSGLGSLADGLIPPSSPLFDAASTTAIPFDVAAAKKGLTDAGWTQDPSTGAWTPGEASQPFTVEVLSPEEAANPVAFATAELVARDWKAIGIGATHVAQPADQPLGDRLRDGDYAAATVPLMIGLDPDLYPLLASTQTRAGGSNVSGIQDPDLDKLLVAARAPASDDARKAAYAALQKKLSETEYILPIAFRDEYVVLKDTVVGPVARPIATSGDRFWDVLTWRLAGGP
jgi:peptide/nickel transport system substrate-binding protein